MTAAAGVWTLIPQWLGTAAAFWLVWWAAKSRDVAPLKVVALLLAIMPAILMPVITIVVIPQMRGAVTSISMLIGMTTVAIGLLRALFLVIWAIVSRDETVLRAVGGTIAGLLLLCYIFGMMVLALMGAAF